MEKQWYYTVNQSERQGPVSQADLTAMIREGRVQGNDLVWADGMGDWQPATQVAELAEAFGGAGAVAAAPIAAAPGAAGAAVGPAGLPEGLVGWMNFVGIFTVISGVLNLCNLLIGIFMIIAGMALLGARTALLELPRIDPAMNLFFDKFRTFLKMMGIFYIVGIVFSVIVMVVYMIMFATMMGSAGMNM